MTPRTIEITSSVTTSDNRIVNPRTNAFRSPFVISARNRIDLPRCVRAIAFELTLPGRKPCADARGRAVELYSTESYAVAVSVTIDLRAFGPGDDAFLEEAWALKERIRKRENVLKQRRGFFTDAYRRSKVYALVEPGYDSETLVGFASTRRDGYILFLAVAPEYRGEGFGRQLVAAVADEHSSVTCHARSTNDGALACYERIGFEIERRGENYYEDRGDAYYLRLGDGGLAAKLSRFVPGA